MERRDLLKAFGAATALALLPGEAVAAWARVASGLRPANGLSGQQLGLVGKILSYPTRLLRLGATGVNVGFTLANVAKDTASAR